MRSKLAMQGFGALVVVGVLAATGTAQQGVVEKAGQKLDDVGRGLRRGFMDISEGFRTRFEGVRADVHRMGVQPRVYSRIHWDKALYESKLEVHVMRNGSVLLRGMVPDEAARKRAVMLAQTTAEVTGVIDELTVLQPVEEPVIRKRERPADEN